MLKQLFALALLSTSVYGRFAPSERQLEAGADQGTGDEWQYCEDKCDETCKECEDHHVCEDGEIKCGEGPTKKSVDGFVLHLCAKDEICVSEDCSCEFISIYVLYLKMHRNHFRYLEYKSIYAWCCCVYCNSFYDPIKNAFIFIFHQVRLQGTTEKSVQLYVTQIAITRPR